MEALPPPLLLVRADHDAKADRWRNRALRWLGAAAIHLLPFTLLVVALPLKPKDLGGTFGQSVAVTLVSGVSKPATATARPTPPSLANLEQRLSKSDPAAPASAPAAQPAAATRLSDLFETQPGASGQAAAKGPIRPTAGADDDPFARASVSYRGDDPQKSARLQSKAQACARGAKALRVLLIINAEGYLVARPRSLSTSAPDKATLKAISAIERCAPFADAATPGPPRSYEIDIG